MLAYYSDRSVTITPYLNQGWFLYSPILSRQTHFCWHTHGVNERKQWLYSDATMWGYYDVIGRLLATL